MMLNSIRSNVLYILISSILLIMSSIPLYAHAENVKGDSIMSIKEKSPLSNEQIDGLIWETHEIIRITSLQCHIHSYYNNFVKKWRHEILSSDKRIVKRLSISHTQDIEGYLTEEDNKIAERLNQYYGDNICMIPESIIKETNNVPYDIEDISNFDNQYYYLRK